MALNSNTELALINTNANAGSITLPLCATNQGRVVSFKDTVGQFGTNTLTLICSGSDTFEDGGTQKVLRESYGSIQLVASGTKWYILNGTQVNTLQLSTLNVNVIRTINLSTLNSQISSLNFIDNRNSTNRLIGSISSVSTQAVSTNFLYYNNYIIAGTRVGYSNLINRYTSNFINPYIIPGLVLWLDSADRNTLFIDNGITPAAVGQSIFRWSDKSLSANHATQSGAAGLRPVLSTDATTSNTVLSFTQSSTQSLNLSPTLLPVGTADATYFVIFRPTQPVVSTRYLCNIFSYGTAGEVGTGVTGRYRLFQSDTTGGSSSGNSFFTCVFASRTNQLITIGQTLILTATISSFLQSYSLNGGNFSTTNLFPFGIFNTGTGFASIGGQQIVGGGTGFLQGDVYEIIVYNTALGLREQQLIQGYLAWKWGIQTQLPVSHPYRSAPP